MIDKGQWREFGQDTGVTPLLFYDECHGIFSDHRESGPRWVCSGALPLTHNFSPDRFSFRGGQAGEQHLHVTSNINTLSNRIAPTNIPTLVQSLAERP